MCLQWWQKLLQNDQVHRVPWDRDVENAAPDFLMFSDAEGGGDTGAVLYPAGSPTGGPTSWYSAGRVPKKWQSRLNSRKTQINVFEQAAVLLAIGTFAPLLEGKRVVFYIDSNAALGSIVKGHSKRQDVNCYAGTVWQLLARHRITAFFKRVPSKQNPADDPSRGQFEQLNADPGAHWWKPVWPRHAAGLVDVHGANCDTVFG